VNASFPYFTSNNASNYGLIFHVNATLDKEVLAPFQIQHENVDLLKRVCNKYRTKRFSCTSQLFWVNTS